MAYELKLPATARIHPVFHVSLLKPCQGHPTSQTSPLPSPAAAAAAAPKPVAVLAHRHRTSKKGVEDEVLVQWEGQDAEEATWELTSTLLQTYPNLDLVDKISFGEGSNDTSQLAKSAQHGKPEDIGPPLAITKPKRITKVPARLLD